MLMGHGHSELVARRDLEQQILRNGGRLLVGNYGTCEIEDNNGARFYMTIDRPVLVELGPPHYTARLVVCTPNMY